MDGVQDCKRELRECLASTESVGRERFRGISSRTDLMLPAALTYRHKSPRWPDVFVRWKQISTPHYKTRASWMVNSNVQPAKNENTVFVYIYLNNMTSEWGNKHGGGRSIQCHDCILRGTYFIVVYLGKEKQRNGNRINREYSI